MKTLRLRSGQSVSRQGWLSPWGIIKISDQRSGAAETEWEGVEYWSNDWAQLRKEPYRLMAIDGQRGLWIIDEQSRQTQFVPEGDIYLVSSRRFLVHSVQGLSYLFWEKELRSTIDHCLRALGEAARGQPPSHIDNDSFIQVPFEFDGQTLIVLDFDGSERRLVFTGAGDPVNFSLVCPLAKLNLASVRT